MLTAADSLTKDPETGALHSIRVLHVIPSVASFRGGPSQVIHMVTEGLSECGLSVTVLTTDDDGIRRLPVQLGEPVREGRVIYWYFPRQTRFYNCSLPLSSWLWRHVSDFHLLHIHTVFSYVSTAAALISRAKAVPYIVRPLGVLNRWGFENRKPVLKRLSFAAIDKHILQHAAAIQYTSEQEQIEAERLCPVNRPVILPNPVRMAADLPARAARTDSGAGAAPQPLILFMSRLDEKKGLDLLIQAFARVKPHYPECRLVVAGSGEESVARSLRLLAEREQVADAIDWVGFVSGAAKQQLLARADVFALTSYSENFGVAVVEAMAAGLPVVITDQIGIHPAITQGGAGLVASCSIESVTEALLKTLADPAAARVMGEHGRRVALTQFSIPVVSQKLLSLYQSILQS
jgi:glycosyltransferase involved in cell wall biosynthesis